MYKEGQYIYINWAQASTGLTPAAWTGQETYDGRQTGAALECIPIGSIAPGKYIDVELDWALPSLMKSYPEGNFHFCLYARIVDETTIVPIDGATFKPLYSRKEAQKNVTIIRKADLNKSYNVYVRNIKDSPASYTLELIPRTLEDATFFSNATVEMKMDDKVFSAWERGGYKGVGLQPVQSETNYSSQRVKLVEANSKLVDMRFNAKDFDVVSLKFDFKYYNRNKSSYTFDLVQKDENGNIIGGETFIVESPTLLLQPVEITSDTTEDGKIVLSVDNEKFKPIKWYNANDELIGVSDTLTVTPIMNNKVYSVVAANDAGDVVLSSISLDLSTGIEIVSQCSNSLLINFKNGAEKNSYIKIVSALNGNVLITSPVDAGCDLMSVDISDVPIGLYVVWYMVESEALDSKKIEIK